MNPGAPITAAKSAGKLPALDGLRALACVSIVLLHSGAPWMGAQALSLFFMLSGFLLYYLHHNTLSWWSGLARIKKFYPLHLVTFALSLVASGMWAAHSSGEFIGQAVLNLLLLHAWAPDPFRFNAVSWFLSAMLFCYAISPLLDRAAAWVRHPKVAIALLLASLLAWNLSLNYPYTVNPLYHSMEFAIGMLVARLYGQRGPDGANCDKIEMALCAVFVAQYVFFNLVWLSVVRATLEQALFAVILYYAAIGRGRVSQWLACRPLRVISKYSFEIYMFHELVFRAFKRFVFTDAWSYYAGVLVLIFVAAPISFAVACCYKEIYDRIVRKLCVSSAKKSS